MSIDEAKKQKEWTHAVNEENQSIKRNESWELATFPKGKKPIGVKWVYKIKENAKGDVVRYKARLIAKGYKQKARS